ncbi:MAG: tRNA-dihydrouridine synthase [Mollicutes bacterium]|nr:tRNA-dihydrouridine synthase [Mollicutes bacterium]MDD7043635.1 tRNA-dihydrouridine synthase [Mollicutes bacterium]
MEKIKIGDIELNGRVVLGPMAGVTTLAYREFMKPFGVALSYSEMISDCGLYYSNNKTLTYFRTAKDDRPVGLQLFGFDFKNTEKAIEVLEKYADYDILDINFGCPVPKVCKTGAGSAWMKRPDEMVEYTKKVIEKSSKPVTIKMRLGWDSEHINCVELAKRMEDIGVKMITIHARTSVQGYTGVPDYEKIRGLGNELNIPLCVSGDIFTPEDALKAMDITGAKLVMVARGGVGNPELVTNINRLLNGEELLPPPSIYQDADYALQFARKLCDYLGERDGAMMLRGLLPKFFTGFPGYKKIRAEISMNIKSYSDIERILNGIKMRNKL